MAEEIIMYTDGSSRGNPGPGGYGIVLVTKARNLRKELSEGFQKTTNNRMELLAVIKGLEALKKPGIHVVIYSDSKYVVDAVEKGWLWNWQKKGFQKTKNPDLWQQFIPLYKKHHVRFIWLKGHAGHPENEKCDEMAVAAALGGNLKKDVGFEA